ncbi:olfactory receptor 6B9-like [Rhinoderma darwinii]|uniref:olfactory receptor 6B9-like n=1 Tax=Rhinoderma darwinii TaxID=43563 RepID=UPI003F680076
MVENNESLMMTFMIVGFPGSSGLQYLFFTLLMVSYLLTLLSNFMIMIITWKERCLQTPMYIFLRNFSFLEVCYVTVTVPKILATITFHGRLISFTGCITQLFFFFFLSSTECFLLGVMAFDRYLAICHPLQYPSLMTISLCNNLSICSWIVGFTTTFPPILLISQLPFCSNSINHFFCDAPPLLKISCVDTSLNDLLDFICASLIIVTSFTVTLLSYIYIIMTVLKIPTTKGRGKAFSTCGSHLTVVIIYYGTVIFMYVRPKGHDHTFTLNRVVSVFYVVVTPILNPIIYCLRNKEVKESVKKHLALVKLFYQSY